MQIIHPPTPLEGGLYHSFYILDYCYLLRLSSLLRDQADLELYRSMRGNPDPLIDLTLSQPDSCGLPLLRLFRSVLRYFCGLSSASRLTLATQNLYLKGARLGSPRRGTHTLDTLDFAQCDTLRVSLTHAEVALVQKSSSVCIIHCRVVLPLRPSPLPPSPQGGGEIDSYFLKRIPCSRLTPRS